MADTFKRFRSAITGRFVTAKNAAKNTATTVSETVKKTARKVKK